jgi:hypothetical protein
VQLFLLKICLANQETTMDATRSHTAGPTKATLNASEVVTVESALGGDLLKAVALSMREIDKLIGELQRAYDISNMKVSGYKAKRLAMHISVGPLSHR